MVTSQEGGQAGVPIHGMMISPGGVLDLMVKEVHQWVNGEAGTTIDRQHPGLVVKGRAKVVVVVVVLASSGRIPWEHCPRPASSIASPVRCRTLAVGSSYSIVVSVGSINSYLCTLENVLL